jgi:hypothetical protein
VYLTVDARRATVTRVYNYLQAAGAVGYGLGQVAVLNRRLLEEFACGMR